MMRLRYLGRVRIASTLFVRVIRYRGLFAFYRKDRLSQCWKMIALLWEENRPVRSLMCYFARQHPFCSHFTTFSAFIKCGPFKKPQFRNTAVFEDLWSSSRLNNYRWRNGTRVCPFSSSLSYSPSAEITYGERKREKEKEKKRGKKQKIKPVPQFVSS